MYCIQIQWRKYTVYCVRQESSFSIITHKVHPVLSQPVEALKEEQEGEEGDKARGEVIPKNSECQARLCHCVPGALDEVLMVEVDDNAQKITSDWIHYCHLQLGSCIKYKSECVLQWIK